ncbi:PAS domain-containing protein [Flagellimonas meridianipacifica]|uniref:PAS domain S-box-containing protein n=1 Tax=Flagellimonas meridianipacifica TaxID=1080225 RepID=A0A2T0MIP2_9FLAO|nr:PAS domain-containing protein [Allomuricauda pacifica]PRX57458.1 PAS domain S-box-containing protein [Allomuricauda pacifica]
MENKGKSYLSPIQSLDFYLENFHALCKKLRLENDLSELKGILKRDLEPSVVNILQTTPYQALVVTDVRKTIIWANHGFNQMTGYSKSFAVGKRPTFLQGRKTSEETKTEIRELLKQQKRFTKALINYRKNGEEYVCHIDVLPLFNDKKMVTHFLAMEKEIAAA